MNAIADCSDSEVDLLTCITDILGKFQCISESADSASLPFTDMGEFQ
jgi:hypothetical protein